MNNQKDIRTYINNDKQRMRSESISSSSSSNSGKYQRFNLNTHLRQHPKNPTYAHQKHKYNYPHQEGYFYVNTQGYSSQKIPNHSNLLSKEKQMKRKYSEPQISQFCNPNDSDREDEDLEEQSLKKRRLSLAFSKKDDFPILKKDDPIDKNAINVLQKFFGEMCKKVSQTPDFLKIRKLFYQALRDIAHGLVKQMNNAKDQMIDWIEKMKVEDQRLREVGVVTEFNNYEDKLKRIMGNIDSLIDGTSSRIQNLIKQSEQYKFWSVKQSSSEPKLQEEILNMSSNKYGINKSLNSKGKEWLMKQGSSKPKIQGDLLNLITSKYDANKSSNSKGKEYSELLSQEENNEHSLRSLVEQIKTQNECKMRDYSIQSQPIQAMNQTNKKPRGRARNQRRKTQVYQKLHNFEETLMKMKASLKL